MNNEKLKIAICGYLPYGVKCETPFGVMELTEIQLSKKNFPYWFGYDHKINSKHFNASICRLKGLISKGFALKEIKPLLFPTSSLTKPIQLSDYNNGLPFVPIVEIGKLFYKFELTRYELDNDIIEYGWEEKGMSDSQYYSFGYYKNGTFGVWHYEIDEDMPIYTECSLEAIDLLNRWKIDYRGLINEGLAIEVNSDNNPYL